MSRIYTKIILTIASLSFIVPAFASSELLSDTKHALRVESTHNQQRESEFKHSEQLLAKQYSALKLQREQLQQSIDALSKTFKINEATLSAKEKQLTLATGSLGELFGVVRQATKNISTQQSPLTVISQLNDERVLKRILAAKSIPSKDDLYGLWHLYQHQVHASGSLELVSVPFVNDNGEVNKKSVLRLGLFNLLDEKGFLHWDAKQNVATPLLVQPKLAPTSLMVSDFEKDLPFVTIDVTKGVLLQQLANEPTLIQRVQQGGIVGNIILILLAVGLLIAAYRMSFLLMVKSKINRQLKNTNEPKPDNPLGRVMLVHERDASPNLEALELRLLEVIMDEQQQLEMGISTIKLLAALAPMLGLLGTVTGMIDTFQTITQFGNADPKIMAGGISMALITTVLGLIAAMPLLLVHNGLSSLAENIRTIIEKQGVGLVAQHAEQQQGKYNK